MFEEGTNTENTSLAIDDTRRNPSAVDYLTKYQYLVSGEDDSYLQFGVELEDTEINDQLFREAEEEPLFQALDDRYTLSDGSFGKDRVDRQNDIGTSTVQQGSSGQLAAASPDEVTGQTTSGTV